MENVPFIFCSGEVEALGNDTLVVRIGATVATRDQLFEQFSTELGLPDYFGGSWDAFDDCLRDLHWVASKRIVILHEVVPSLPEESLRIYLEVLARVVNDWKRDGDQHEVVVVFPVESQLRIRDLLKPGVDGGN